IVASPATAFKPKKTTRTRPTQRAAGGPGRTGRAGRPGSRTRAQQDATAYRRHLPTANAEQMLPAGAPVQEPVPPAVPSVLKGTSNLTYLNRIATRDPK